MPQMVSGHSHAPAAPPPTSPGAPKSAQGWVGGRNGWNEVGRGQNRMETGAERRVYRGWKRDGNTNILPPS